MYEYARTAEELGFVTAEESLGFVFNFCFFSPRVFGNERRQSLASGFGGHLESLTEVGWGVTEGGAQLSLR